VGVSAPSPSQVQYAWDVKKRKVEELRIHGNIEHSLIVASRFLLANICEEKVSYCAHLFRKCLHFALSMYRIFMVRTH